MKQLSGQDNSFLGIESIGLPQHISSVAIYDQSTADGKVVRFKDILGHLESRLHLSSIFRCKLQQVSFGADRPYLVDDPDFDLEYHVRHIALPKPRDIEPEGVRIIENPHSDAALLGRAYLNALRKPRRFYELGRTMLVSRKVQRQKPEEARTEGAKRLVSTRFNGEISPHRVLDAITFDFAEIRAIKNTLDGATINDVMLTIVSGALHKYLAAKGELPEETLTCGCPIDVRDDSERGTGGNVIGFMGVNLCTEYEDAAQRFLAVHEAAEEAKAHARASDVRINKQIMDTVPGGIMTTAMRVTAAMGVQATPFNTMLTNIPGPPNQLYFAGAQIVEGFGIGPLVPSVGLFHTASSSVMNKEGKINLSFWACRDMLPDPEIYRGSIEESCTELKSATLDATSGNKKAAKRKPKGRKQKHQ